MANLEKSTTDNGIMESKDGVLCPICGHLHITEIEDTIDYWDCVSDFTCDACNSDFRVTSRVTRTWESQ